VPKIIEIMEINRGVFENTLVFCSLFLLVITLGNQRSKAAVEAEAIYRV